ncbi:polysaccharide biosynthesis/export family protein [Flavisolibacter sp. BT320]|nr:polysaccharide biosynthesis/export family protein [Flavisolibacter longurius]
MAALNGLLGCQPVKNTAYFQTLSKDTVLRNTTTRNFDLAIKPGDILSIAIASASSELSASFNTAPAGEGSNGGYLVDKLGNIELYKLGSIKVAGMNKAALQDKLRQELTPYLKDPVVTVRFANHRATVLGAVGNPGVIPLSAEGVTVLEAIGQSGDLAENSKRDKVLVIRQTDEGKVFHFLNLLDHSVFTSPYFYLQNEDVVYVEPETKKEKIGPTQVFSYIISGISILSLIISRIR